jgi:hypothetical protein
VVRVEIAEALRQFGDRVQAVKLANSRKASMLDERLYPLVKQNGKLAHRGWLDVRSVWPIEAMKL